MTNQGPIIEFSSDQSDCKEDITSIGDSGLLAYEMQEQNNSCQNMELGQKEDILKDSSQNENENVSGIKVAASMILQRIKKNIPKQSQT
ncbi:hypothetical protein O181_035153 [Austropuccinia psidii MF-1]|uniref:Uncharacterized protein n=1 Tax=Austropuccinia psidii MF-1 TaxID=1389203 RepID=A0A9Q3D4X0_9BASI|nr:hypothetical protein [Austropuccinia psidii MF-1]